MSTCTIAVSRSLLNDRPTSDGPILVSTASIQPEVVGVSEPGRLIVPKPAQRGRTCINTVAKYLPRIARAMSQAFEASRVDDLNNQEQVFL